MMTWIFKVTPDERGGHVQMNAIHPETMEDWSDTLPDDVPVALSRVYKGKNAALKTEHVPRTFVTPKRMTQFKDLFWVENGMFVISERFRSIIEEHDPGVHHIWPIQVLSKKGSAYPDVLYGFVPSVHANALSEAESDVRITEESLSPPNKTFPDGMFSPRMVFLNPSYDAAVEIKEQPKENIWWDHGFERTNELLLSDSLHDAIVEAALKVIPMKKLRIAKGAANV